jgi:hypothetical protein
MTLPVSDKNECEDGCEAAPDTARDFDGWLFTIVGTHPPILKSILAKAVIYPIGAPAVRFGAKIGRPVRPSCM